MNAPLDGERVPRESSVLRLPRPPPDFSPDGWRPTYKQFEPSSEDKAHAKARSKPVRVSVWDLGHTTIAEAKAFRSGDSIALRLSVEAIERVAEQRQHSRLVCVYDELEPAERDRPGAHGHAGIEGLDRRNGESNNAYKDMRQALADECDCD